MWLKLILLSITLTYSWAQKECPHPAVPYAATYTNVTGGPAASNWKINYVCDRGYTLFGEKARECKEGKWKGDLPVCAVNVALNKPASSSSTNNGGRPENAVDGKTSTVHEGKKCTETKSEKSPWWTVDLLEAAKIQFVRLTTRCCDDLPIKNAEIRVGNSTTPTSNPLCYWISKELDEGVTETFECVEPLVGKYVSILRSGVEDVLSLCEVEVFSASGLSIASCTEAANPDQLAVFDNSCFHFLNEEISGFDEAVQKCQAEDYSLLDHLTESSTKFVTTKVDQDRSDSSKSYMIWLGANRQRTGNFRGEEWRWTNSEEPVEVIEWGKGQPNNYNQEQDCAVLDSDLNWGWNDLSCRISAHIICRGKPSRCPSPPTAEGTTVTLSSGTFLTYHCPIGQMPIGEVNQTCQESGKWNGLPIGCKPVECGQVPGLVNGEIHVLDGRTTWGARVKYKCKEDYSISNGNSERVCTESGWSGSAPECVYTKCPELDIVENADVTIINGDRPNYLGSKVAYTCKEGYKPSGSLARECLQGGKWSGTPPKCEFLDCGQPPPVKNANFVLKEGRTSYGSSVEYTCVSDYLPVGDAVKKCESTGSWSRNILTCDIIECPQPRAPSGGRVSGYNREIHSKIEYSCLPGHVLEGDQMVTCTGSGLWSSRAPTCRYVDCGQVPILPDGTNFYVNGSTHLGSRVRYTCDKSHSILGDFERECLSNGLWSGQTPSCSEIRCDLPPRPNNTIVSVSSTERLHGTSVLRSKLSQDISYRVGSTLKYRCERGYILKSESGQDLRVMTRRCTTTGEWTGDTPTCIYVDCGNPVDVENAEYVLQTNNGTYYGSVVNYKCNDHFKMDGFERRRCETSGKWEPEAPSCKETLCKPLESPANGSMILSTLRIGGTATFICDEGFSLKGDDDIECLSSGSWSAWPPTCLEVDCGQPFEIENGRVFLTNGSTNIGSIVEYHCFPGYERTGTFQRVCLEDGYWSGPEPECNKPRPVTILSDNTVDGTHNIRAGGREDAIPEGSSVGLYIGIALGLIVVLGLMILGIYFYKKQQALASKPPAPYRDRNANGGVSMVGGYAATGVYHTASAPPNNSQVPPRTAGINTRPPPPIQMYSMDENTEGVANGSGAAPIYDTINDDHSSGGGASRYSAGSDRYNPSTFKNGSTSFQNGGYNHDYDTPEGSDPNRNTVTINGIAV